MLRMPSSPFCKGDGTMFTYTSNVYRHVHTPQGYQVYKT